MGAKWFWSILLLALLSFLATCVGPYSSYSKNITETIQGSLAADNISDLDVRMDGTAVNLTGEVANASIAERAVEIAKNAVCAERKNCGACNADGSAKVCHTVENNLTVANAKPVVKNEVAPVAPPVTKLAEQSPYVLTARKYADDRVVLDGYVPSEDARAAILADANSRFSTVIDDRLKLAGGAPTNWTGVAQTKLSELQTLNNGAVVMEDYQVMITGIGDSVAVREAINVSTSTLGDGYVGSANIQVSDAATALVGQVSSQLACQTMFDVLKGEDKIQFAYNKSDLRGGETFDLLNRLASAASQCDQYGIVVEGHTDSDGADSYNEWLSEARANAVVEYLVANNVSPSRLTAIGKGESEPIASNDTKEGKALNRRTKFVVTQLN